MGIHSGCHVCSSSGDNARWIMLILGVDYCAIRTSSSVIFLYGTANITWESTGVAIVTGAYSNALIMSDREIDAWYY